jgi:hypothetical protein
MKKNRRAAHTQMAVIAMNLRMANVPKEATVNVEMDTTAPGLLLR